MRALVLGSVVTLAAGLLPAGVAEAATGGDLVISEVFGGGGGTNAPYNQDFVELHNRTGSAISLAGYSVQYASAIGSSWTVVNLTGAIAAHGYYLVALATGSNGVALPGPDLSSTSLNISNAQGKVALLSATGACSGTCLSNANLLDYVGYGATASAFEGSGAAPTLNASLSAKRKGSGDTDTNDNAADFQSGTPDPQNTASSPSNPDTDPPTGVKIGPVPPFQASSATTIGWSATDAGVGVAGYTVKVRLASIAADFGAGDIWQNDVSATSADWFGGAGQTACFSVKARDANNNESGYSTERCTAFPLDDPALTPTGFTAVASRGSYFDSVSRATKKGATLVGPTVTGKRFALMVTRCPTCGSVKVLWNNVAIKTIALTAKKTTKRAIVPLPVRPSAETGVLTIVVTTTGKPVLIDGLVVSRN
ncbi:MAG: lamin tail domain-containing protein [Chloroflexota bacterium]